MKKEKSYSTTFYKHIYAIIQESRNKHISLNLQLMIYILRQTELSQPKF